MVSFDRKCNFTRGSNVGMVHFCGYRKFNHPNVISFVIIICFGLHNRKKQPFFMDSTCVLIKLPFDVDNCGGTHNINDICMKVWKNHIFKKRCK
jgi:hypothetical protein